MAAQKWSDGICLYAIHRSGPDSLEAERLFVSPLVDGNHPGGVERRPKCDRQCEFDGQSALIHVSEHCFALFARANRAAEGGVPWRAGLRRHPPRRLLGV